MQLHEIRVIKVYSRSTVALSMYGTFEEFSFLTFDQPTVFEMNFFGSQPSGLTIPKIGQPGWDPASRNKQQKLELILRKPAGR